MCRLTRVAVPLLTRLTGDRAQRAHFPSAASCPAPLWPLPSTQRSDLGPGAPASCHALRGAAPDRASAPPALFAPYLSMILVADRPAEWQHKTLHIWRESPRSVSFRSERRSGARDLQTGPSVGDIGRRKRYIIHWTQVGGGGGDCRPTRASHQPSICRAFLCVCPCVYVRVCARVRVSLCESVPL